MPKNNSTEQWTIEQFNDYNSKSKKKKNKFGAVQKSYQGKKYHSTKEADESATLDLLKYAKNKSDQIVKKEEQIRFKLIVDGVFITTYILDFRNTYADGRIEHVDVKGYKKGTVYEMFLIKKRLMKVCYGIDVIEK